MSIKDNNALKLLKFEISVFYGKVNKKIIFKEYFITTIHNNENLSDKLKFSQLVAYFEK